MVMTNYHTPERAVQLISEVPGTATELTVGVTKCTVEVLETIAHKLPDLKELHLEAEDFEQPFGEETLQDIGMDYARLLKPLKSLQVVSLGATFANIGLDDKAEDREAAAERMEWEHEITLPLAVMLPNLSEVGWKIAAHDWSGMYHSSSTSDDGHREERGESVWSIVRDKSSKRVVRVLHKDDAAH